MYRYGAKLLPSVVITLCPSVYFKSRTVSSGVCAYSRLHMRSSLPPVICATDRQMRLLRIALQSIMRIKDSIRTESRFLYIRSEPCWYFCFD